jgi:hypothetical protein
MPRFTRTDRRAAFDLIGFGSNGEERTDDPDGLMSDQILRTLADDESGITDVFLLCHGWLGDIPAARAHYDEWVESMTACTADIARIKQMRPGFQPHVVGIHWPSMPWGEESFDAGTSFSVAVDGVPGEDPVDDPAKAMVDGMVDDYAARIADTPAARDAIRRIVVGSMEDMDPDSLPPEVIAAYRELNLEANLGIGGVGAGPGGDRAGFDPEGTYQSLREDSPSFGLFSGEGILGPLRTLSFWRMKDKARWFGETVASQLLARMMQAAPRELRFHLMGHSFGCIVMSAALAGPKGRGRIARPVESLALFQGALSVWSYCQDIPSTPGQPGYFYKVIADRRVRGPIIATQSAYDTATGKWYPLGAGIAGQVSFASPGQVPKYGAVGSFGIRGPGVSAIDMRLPAADVDCAFRPGTVYNLECSDVIRRGSGRGGAHSDICYPRLAHAVWQAAIAAG